MAADAEVRLERTLPAPPSEVYRAFLDPDRLRRWFGPADVRIVGADVDPRPGGHHRTTVTASDGTRGTILCRIRDLIPDRRIVMTWTWQVDGATPDDPSLLTIDLRETTAGHTDLTLVHSRLHGSPHEDPAGITTAWTQALAKLTTHLATAAQ